MENRKEALARLENYLHTIIEAPALALELRRLKLETVRLLLNDKEGTYDKEWIANGLYFLDGVCEALDPYLEPPTATGTQQ